MRHRPDTPARRSRLPPLTVLAVLPLLAIPAAPSAAQEHEDAPRDGDGTLPYESCTEADPTTGGCVSPRTLHTLEQIQLAGFTRYVKRFRNGGSGEHPLGKAYGLGYGDPNSDHTNHVHLSMR